MQSVELRDCLSRPFDRRKRLFDHESGFFEQTTEKREVRSILEVPRSNVYVRDLEARDVHGRLVLPGSRLGEYHTSARSQKREEALPTSAPALP